MCRFYEEYEYERRLKKRRAKLITATEEAFAHIKRMPGDHMKGEFDIFQAKISHGAQSPSKKRANNQIATNPDNVV